MNLILVHLRPDGKPSGDRNEPFRLSSWPSRAWRRRRRSPSRTIATRAARSPASPERFVKNYKARRRTDAPLQGSQRLERHDARHRDARARRRAAAGVHDAIARANGNLDLINGAGARPAERPAEEARRISRASSTVHYDRPIKTHNYRTAVTVGARTVQDYARATPAPASASRSSTRASRPGTTT